MSIPILADLIALGEGFTTEFKRSFTPDLGREICAFANATGGVILIGVDDAGTVIGVEDHNRLKCRVQSVARSADPPVVVEVESAGEVLLVSVPEQHGRPYFFGGRLFVREGATCQQLPRDEIRDFFFREGLIRMDETPCSAFDPSVEITSSRWAEFAEQAGIDPGLNPTTVLENLHLLSDDRMTHAGAWLLADDITRFTLQASVICAVFRGGTKTHILDRKEFNGNLYAIYQEVMTYLRAKLNSALVPNARGREERLELPVIALREALVNAIAHRDYRSTAKVQVYIFQDRVEIVTPGGLPAGMGEKDLGSRSVPRNPLLFNMLYRMGLVEQIGSGIRRIHDACREHGAAKPTIDVSFDWVTVIFPRSVESATTHVTPHVGRLISVLNGEMGRAELMDALALRDRHHFARNYLQPGMYAGLVEMNQPDRPRSRSQGFRLTRLGLHVRDSISAAGGAKPTIDGSPDWVPVIFPRTAESATPHVAPHVAPHIALHATPHVARLISVLDGELGREELMDALWLKDRRHFTNTYLQPGLDAGLVEMTQPECPRSRTQGYRLTGPGLRVRDSMSNAGGA